MARRRQVSVGPEWVNWINTVEKLLDKWKMLLEHLNRSGGIASATHDWPDAYKVAFAQQAEAFGEQWKQIAMALYATCEVVEIRRDDTPQDNDLPFGDPEDWPTESFLSRGDPGDDVPF
jgi:hypothetical protein